MSSVRHLRYINILKKYAVRGGVFFMDFISKLLKGYIISLFLTIISTFSNLIDNTINLIPRLLNKLDVNVNYIILSFTATITFAILYEYVLYPLSIFPIFTPLYEEIQKLFFLLINFNLGVTFVIVLSLYEFSCYLIQTQIDYGVINPAFLIIRLFVIMMHIYSFAIINEGVKLYRHNDKVRPLILLFFAAVAVHHLWNSFLGEYLYFYIYCLMN